MINSVEIINQQASEYRELGILLIVVAIVFAIAAVVLWIVLDISHSIRVITGVGMDKELRKIREKSKSGKGLKSERAGQVIAWNTSGLLKKEKSARLDESTTVIEEYEFDEEATTVLEEINEDFVIEDEIRITGTDKKI